MYPGVYDSLVKSIEILNKEKYGIVDIRKRDACALQVLF